MTSFSELYGTKDDGVSAEAAAEQGRYVLERIEGMTVVPAGPDPADLVTDELIAALRADGWVIQESQHGSMREFLMAASPMIVAAWQRWEEQQDGPAPDQEGTGR